MTKTKLQKLTDILTSGWPEQEALWFRSSPRLAFFMIALMVVILIWLEYQR